MSTPFDEALSRRELDRRAREYALRHGKPGCAAYRTAWMRFRQKFKTLDDLERWRAARARREQPAAQGSESRSGTRT